MNNDSGRLTGKPEITPVKSGIWEVAVRVCAKTSKFGAGGEPS